MKLSASGVPFAVAAPVVFVVLWSSGFVVARLVAPHTDPLTFLAVRYALTIVVLTALALLAGAAWPRSMRAILTLAVSGLLLHGVYLGGVFWAVHHGLPAGVAGLFSGLQPLATAALAGPLLGERVGWLRWTGIALGFAGTALVLAPIMGTAPGDVPWPALAAGLAAIAGITAGTLWQKRHGAAMDLRTGNVVQFSAALLPTALAAMLLENGRFDLVADTIVGLLWATFGLSIGAIMLLLEMIRRGAVSRVAALLYLVPPVTALMAWAMFGEALAPVQLAGMALAAAGVALAGREAR